MGPQTAYTRLVTSQMIWMSDYWSVAPTFFCKSMGLWSSLMGIFKTLYWNYVRQWTYWNMDELTNKHMLLQHIDLLTNHKWYECLIIDQLPPGPWCHIVSLSQCHAVSRSLMSELGNYSSLLNLGTPVIILSCAGMYTHYCELWWIEMSLSFVVELVE